MSDSRRILVVDDEPDLLKIVEIFLKRWEFQVDVFGEPLEALAHFEKNACSYFLIMTDVRMPSMNGLELAGRILKIKPDIKIIVMTAFEMTKQELESKLQIVKYEDLLQKPFTLTQVCNAVKKQTSY